MRRIEFKLCTIQRILEYYVREEKAGLLVISEGPADVARTLRKVAGGRA